MAGSTTARALRRRMTDAERRLWHALRDRRLGGWKFRRQHPIEGYVVEFCCLEACLIVEWMAGSTDPTATARERPPSKRPASASCGSGTTRC